MYLWTIYSLAYALAAVVALGAAVLAWRRRQLPAARYLAFTLLAIAWWAAAIAVESAASTIDGKLLWSQIAYIGTTGVPLCYLLLAAAYTRRQRWLDRGVVALLALPPLATTLIAFTNASHGLLWREIVIQSETNLATYAKGPWFALSVLHAYAYLALGASFFLRHMDQAGGANRRQIRAFLGAAALPLLANLLYLSGYNPIPGLDWTVPAFVAAGVIMAWALLRLRLLEIGPVARALLLDMMSAGVLVIDEHGRVIDANPAIAHLTGISPERIVGQTASDLFDGAPLISDWLARGLSGSGDTTWDTSSGPRRIMAQLAAVPPATGGIGARLLVVHDITELEHARANVKRLESLLPICASCKRIRTDEGYWLAVEAYLHQHRGIEFTHGLCPDCLRYLCRDSDDTEGEAPCP